MCLVVHLSCVRQGDIPGQVRVILAERADPAVHHRPLILIPVFLEEDVKVLGVLAIIHHEQDGAFRDPGIAFHEIRQLRRGDGLKALIVEG